MRPGEDRNLEFIATEVGTITDFGVLSCGAAGNGHYVTVQANLHEPDEWGVYFEIDDQINGSYDVLRNVQLTDRKLVFTLNRGTNWYPNLEQVAVNLHNVDSAEIESLRNNLNTCLTQCGLVVT